MKDTGPATPRHALVMLTGNQIASARRLVGFRTQISLATAADLSRPTIERAESARDQIPAMSTDAMVKIVRALEAAGIEFRMDGGATLTGRSMPPFKT